MPGGSSRTPDDMHTSTIQRKVVSTCFAYGRVYSYTPTINVRSKLKAPWFESADNVLGGECNVVGMPCYTLTTTVGRHYTNPAGWANVLKNETGDEWDDLQFYQLVTGSSSQSKAYSWDCTSSNWKLHWTSHTEMYCLNDFMTIIAQHQAGHRGHRPGDGRHGMGSRHPVRLPTSRSPARIRFQVVFGGFNHEGWGVQDEGRKHVSAQYCSAAGAARSSVRPPPRRSSRPPPAQR